MEEKIPFERFGTMIDCSRNAVLSVDGAKDWIDSISDLGYNMLMLYTEDTYEIKDEPYFGYGRGRYTENELKELDRYAAKHGVELIPCIQTLAHLATIARWPAYKPYIDSYDILLAGEDRVYELIDRMFATLAKCFTTRKVNVGMDEAYSLGRGKYYDLHGDCDHSQILLTHLNRVAEISKKYGFTLCMWSDMFYKLASENGSIYNGETQIDEEVKKKIPDNVELIYWDYYGSDKERYKRMIASHEMIKEGTWFAGGFQSWIGFAPHNGYTLRTARAVIPACKEQKVKNVMFTMWGDGGGECARFSLLPSVFFTSELAKGNDNVSDIKEKFEKKYKIPFDKFMLLDLVGPDDSCRSPEKYLLYNDLFFGLFDTTLVGNEGKEYAAMARKLAPWCNHERFGYLFRSEHALCRVLAMKANMGVRIREAYKANDKDTLLKIAKECKELIKRVKVYHKCYAEQWFTESKPQGFEVQDQRMGGLVARIAHCADRLVDYANGKTDRIDELEESLLDYNGNGTDYKKELVGEKWWKNIVTTNNT